jgi:hypothetical protein
MKKTLVYLPAFIMLSLLFLGSCKRDVVTIPKKSGATVSTIALGNYNYITVDKSGNIYGLKPGFGDTIYRITQSGVKSVFYVPPVTTQADTTVKFAMDCLATDSSDNIYTVLYNSTTALPNVIKISSTGSASVVYSGINLPLINEGMEGSAKIAFDGLGNFYFGGYYGLYKIATSGTTSQISNLSNNVFTADSHGNVYYSNVATANVIQKVSASGTTTAITLTTHVFDMCGDVFGNVYISALTNANSAATTVCYIQKLKPNDSVTTILSSPLGHVDGPVATAQIWPAFSPATDASGNLYFSEVSYSPADIRKITF